MDTGPTEMTSEQRAEMREARRIRVERRWWWARIVVSIILGAIFGAGEQHPLWHVLAVFVGCAFGVACVEFVRTTYPRRKP